MAVTVSNNTGETVANPMARAFREAIYAGLRELRREVEFLRVPGEGHFFNVFGSLRRRLARTSALDEFLVRRLRDDQPDNERVREEVTHAGR